MNTGINYLDLNQLDGVFVKWSLYKGLVAVKVFVLYKLAALPRFTHVNAVKQISTWGDLCLGQSFQWDISHHSDL